SLICIFFSARQASYRTATPSPKLRQLALRDKYPLLLRLQFPNASSERRALPKSGTSVLEWNRAPTLVWQRMPRVALPTEMEAGYRLARANWTRFNYHARADYRRRAAAGGKRRSHPARNCRVCG